MIIIAHINAAREQHNDKLTRRRKRSERSERSCRRSGAAPCCAAVMTLEPPLPRRQSTLSRAETFRSPKPKTRRRAEALRQQKTKSRARAEKLRGQKPRTPRQNKNASTAETPTRLLASSTATYQRPEYPRRTITIRQAQQHNDKLTRRRKRREEERRTEL